MDKIAWHSFPQGTDIIVYADGILIQCDSLRTLTTALQHLDDLCIQMGLVINTSKTKFQSTLQRCRPPHLNGVPLERVQSYKYLGVQLSFKKSTHCVQYVRDLCLPRLAP